MSSMHGLVSTIIGAITVVVIVYILLQRSAAVKTVAKGATQEYGRVASTFQGA